MFDRHHLAGVARQAGAQHGLGDQVRARRDLDHRVQVHAPEHDAGVRLRGPQHDGHLLAGMQSDAFGADLGLQAALLEHA